MATKGIKGIKGTRVNKGIKAPKGVKGPKIKAVVVAKTVPVRRPVPVPVPAPGTARPKVVIHHHHYPSGVPASRPAAPVANPMRPRLQAPTNSGLRFSGSPNAFRYGGGNRGPGQGGLI